MFANCQMGGVHFGVPDTCNTPSPTGVTPIPYPNTSQGSTANPGTACKKVLLMSMPAHNLMTKGTISNGDEAGVALGVASGMVMGPHSHLKGSMAVIYESGPVTRLTDMTGQNGMSLNITGATIAPAQTKVMIMK